MRALRRDPAARYPGAEAFGQALEHPRGETTQRIPAVASALDASSRARSGVSRALVRSALALGILGLVGAGYLGVRSLGISTGAVAGHTAGTPGAKAGPTTPPGGDANREGERRLRSPPHAEYSPCSRAPEPDPLSTSPAPAFTPGSVSTSASTGAPPCRMRSPAIGGSGRFRPCSRGVTVRWTPRLLSPYRHRRSPPP